MTEGLCDCSCHKDRNPGTDFICTCDCRSDAPPENVSVSGTNEEGAVMGDIWIPYPPLPFQNWRTDQCGSCFVKFRGRDRLARYEEHWMREHAMSSNREVKALVPADHPFVAILREVQSGTTSPASQAGLPRF